MDTVDHVRVKRERVVATLLQEFRALGIQNPPLPEITWSKRKYEACCYEARHALRQLKTAIAVSTCLEDMSLKFDPEGDTPERWLRLGAKSLIQVCHTMENGFA